MFAEEIANFWKLPQDVVNIQLRNSFFEGISCDLITIVESISKLSKNDAHEYNFEILREFAKLENLTPDKNFEELLKPTFKIWSNNIIEILTKTTTRCLNEEKWEIKSGKLYSIACFNFLSVISKIFEPIQSLIIENENSFTRLMKKESGKLLSHC